MSLWAEIQNQASGTNLKAEDICFEEFVYLPDRIDGKIVAHDIYRGMEYFVVSMGTHPCAYVKCPKEFLDEHSNDWGYAEGIYVHGGITWSGEMSGLRAFRDKDGEYCFGWDYAHAGDYLGSDSYTPWDNRKWTTEMIVNECKSAIDQYWDMQPLKDEGC